MRFCYWPFAFLHRIAPGRQACVRSAAPACDEPEVSRANNPMNLDIYTYGIRGRCVYATFRATF